MFRWKTSEDGFVDLPIDCGFPVNGRTNIEVSVFRDGDEGGDEFAIMTGTLLHSDDEWNVYSCGGLLVKTRITKSTDIRFLIRCISV